MGSEEILDDDIYECPTCGVVMLAIAYETLPNNIIDETSCPDCDEPFTSFILTTMNALMERRRKE